MVQDKGSLKETSVIRLLLAIYNQQKTGLLHLIREDIAKILYFKRGRLIWAISNSETDRLDNMLLANGKISQEALDDLVMNESGDEDSISKALVEKGFVSLKELISLTKIQLERIIFSVLRYRDGEYQFVQDQPPKRLLSLDADITSFIRNFILDELSESDIWKELKSPRTIYRKNDKIAPDKFNFSKKQLELLQSFDQGKPLEKVMERYSSAHKNSLLKIIYFFALADLIITEDSKEEEEEKKKNRQPPEDDFEQKTGDHFDSIMAEPGQPLVPETKDQYTFGEEAQWPEAEEAKPLEIDLEHAPEAPPPLPPESSENSESVEEMIREEEKNRHRSRRGLWFLVMLLILIGGGLWLYFSGTLDSLISSTFGQHRSRPSSTALPPPPDSRRLLQSPEVASPLRAQKPVTPSPSDSSDSRPIDSPPPATDPRQSLLRGDLSAAARIWKEQVSRRGIQYSILLELDCLKESVLKAYEKMERNPGFFILPQKRESKTCYLVLYGRYMDEISAEKALQEIPDYFFLQQNPPVIIPLVRYLK